MANSVKKPIWAIENEINMLHRDALRVKQRQKELDVLMKILRVVEIVQEQSFDRRDLVITVKFSDILQSDSIDDALLEAEIKRGR